jgi:hypothetical protein
MPVLSTLGAATAKAWGFLQQVAAATDPFFEYVTMLLTGNGTNGAQNNTFLDSSTNNFSITRNGNTTQGSFSPYGANWSNYFDGSGDYLSTPSSITLGAGDLTIEGWIYPSNATGGVWYDFRGNDSGSAGNNPVIQWSTVTANKFTVRINGTNAITSSNTFSTNNWHHVALVRSGTTVTLYVNGTSEGTYTTNTSFAQAYVRIGAYGGDGSVAFTGYASNLRAVIGTAVYTTTFTPSTAPLTAITNTALLTCQSNRFRDASANNYAITVNGNTSIQRFSPFSPTASYSTATIGGSGFFDGTGDTLTTPSNSALNLGSGNWTIDFWVYPLALVTVGTNMPTVFNYGGKSNNKFQIYPNLSNGGRLSLYSSDDGNDVLNASTPLPLNTWTHIRYTRSSNTWTLYMNGVQDAQTTNSTTLNLGSLIQTIGGVDTANGCWNGYISDVRVIVGTALSASVPTSPLTAVSGTQLLTNMTNAGIPDSAMMNNLETVGNAQVSTSVVKYGTGSISLSASGNTLQTRELNPDINVGSGNFTIEGWANITTVQGSGDGNGVFQMSSTVGGFAPNQSANLALGVSEGTGWQVYAKNTYTSASLTVNANTWYHFALVRNGTTTVLYINGTALITLTSDTTTYNTPYIGLGSIYDSTSYPTKGYIDDFRITKGYARYTSNFTSPTAAFPTF